LMGYQMAKNRYHIFLIKPSKYDDDGYVITWSKGVITSNSLACVNALAEQIRDHKVLGPDVDMVIHPYDAAGFLQMFGGVIQSNTPNTYYQ